MDKNINLRSGKFIYFASDFHLGIAGKSKAHEREKKIVSWLDSIKKDAQYVFLLGDIFDFWYEYRRVIPKGFVRFQGKVAELTDSGIEVIFFRGNHDMWMFRYFQQELGIQLEDDPISLTINEKKFHIGHGDGLGPGDSSYKFIKKVFRNPLAIALFRYLPPRLGMGIASAWSAKSRLSNLKKGEEFKSAEDEYLFHYCREVEKSNHHDYYIFGHRHLILDLELESGARYYNLGEWVNHSHYLVFDGQEIIKKDY